MKVESSAKRHQSVPGESANDAPPLDNSIEYMSQLDIPRFEESEENDGVLAGLKGESGCCASSHEIPFLFQID